MISTSEPIWRPNPDHTKSTAMAEFMSWLGAHDIVEVDNYTDLWQWSIADLPTFWSSFADFVALPFAHRGTAPVLQGTMPGARWFDDSQFNFVDRILQMSRGDAAAIFDVREGDDGSFTVDTYSWTRLFADAGALATQLRDRGVVPGDRVAGYLPNCYEGAVALIATASIGAVWAACGIDYGAKAAIDRLSQLEPKVVICADGYRYAGKTIDKRAEAAEFVTSLSSAEVTVWIPRLGLPAPEIPGGWLTWSELTGTPGSLSPVPVPFGHPLWVLFSSGTTGTPKGMVHSHGGVALEIIKQLSLHLDVKPGDRFWWHTTPSWMLWNVQVSALLVGATITCYDGSPTAGGTGSVWQLAEQLELDALGTSPGYLGMCMKDGLRPALDYDLSRLRFLGITGSPLAPAIASWIQDELGPRVQTASLSGGTEVCTSFAGAAPIAPIWPGEMSVPYLGVAIACFDGLGLSTVDQVGEMVITQPMPSMPLYFWADPDASRYRQTYFDTYPDVWRHGDLITITSHGSVIVHGRSDSTLNRHGVRLGTGEIYEVAEGLPEIVEALIVGVEQPDGGYWLPMFVQLADGQPLTDSLIAKVRKAVSERLSPRHVPDSIHAAPAIPHTRTGKKLEVPIKRLLQGADSSSVLDRNSVDKPEVIDWYVAFAQQASQSA